MKITDVTSAQAAAQVTVSRLAPAAEPAVQMASPSPQSTEPSAATLARYAEQANEAMRKAGEHLSFSVHQDTNRIVVKLVDDATDKVVREYPSEKYLDLVADLMKLAGLHVDETV